MRSSGSPSRSQALAWLRLLQDPLADFVHEAGGFRDGDELHGRHLAQLDVLPAQQGFHAAHLARHQVQLRLVVQRELPAADRPPRWHSMVSRFRAVAFMVAS